MKLSLGKNPDATEAEVRKEAQKRARESFPERPRVFLDVEEGPIR